MSRGLDYSKWDHIEVSDDEDDTHPNIDTPLKVEAKELSEDDVKKLEIELTELMEQEKKEEAELAKKERIINKPKKKEDIVSEEEYKQMLSFIEKYENEIKPFGMIQNHDTSAEYLRDSPHLVRKATAYYLNMWCANLELQSKPSMMKTVAHQSLVMQYILELASQLDIDIPGFFERIKSVKKKYGDAYDHVLQSFIKGVQTCARALTEEHEEEERQKRLGPGGLDPLEVMETLPSAMREGFETLNVPMLQTALNSLSESDCYRCIASGLLVADAEAAGLTPASEELQKMAAEQDGDEDSDEHYESLDDQEDDKNKDGQ